MGYKILQALKALYVKLGGTASTVADVTQTPDMINAIAGLDIGGGSGSSLPAVTSDDNGSVLTVVEGAWDKVAGNNDFVVTFSEDSGTFTSDKTFAEITSAIEASKNVKGLFNDGQGDVLVSLAKYMNDYIYFYGTVPVIENSVITVNAVGFMVYDNDTITFGFATLANATD